MRRRPRRPAGTASGAVLCPSATGSLYRGGPAVSVTLAVLCWPDGVTQVRDTTWPGRVLRDLGVQGLRRADRLAVHAGDDRSGRHPRDGGGAAADGADDQGARAHRGDRGRDGQVGVVGVAALAAGPISGGSVTAEPAQPAEAVVLLLLLRRGLLLRVAAGALPDVDPDERRVADRDGGAGVARGDLPGHREGGVDRDGEARRRLLVGETHVVAGGVHADDRPAALTSGPPESPDTMPASVWSIPCSVSDCDRAALVAGRDGPVDAGDVPGRGDDLALPFGIAQGRHRVTDLDLGRNRRAGPGAGRTGAAAGSARCRRSRRSRPPWPGSSGRWPRPSR